MLTVKTQVPNMARVNLAVRIAQAAKAGYLVQHCGIRAAALYLKHAGWSVEAAAYLLTKGTI